MYLKVRVWHPTRPDGLTTHPQTRGTIFGTRGDHSGFAVPTHTFFLSVRPEELPSPADDATAPLQQRYQVLRQWLTAELGLYNGWTIEELSVLREAEGQAVFQTLRESRRHFFGPNLATADNFLD